MPVQYWSSNFVFSTAARLNKLPPVTAPGEILPFQLVKQNLFGPFSNWIKIKGVFPSILIQLENGPKEFYFYFYFVLRH